MDKEEAIRRAKEEEEKHIPSMEELEEEDKDFKKMEKDAFKLLKKASE